jgi:hypothetical protein
VTILQAQEPLQEVLRQTLISIPLAEKLKKNSMSMNLAQSAQTQTAQSQTSREDLYLRCRSRVLARIEQAATGKEPFYHTFVEEVFPADFYDAVRAHMSSFNNCSRKSRCEE